MSAGAFSDWRCETGEEVFNCPIFSIDRERWQNPSLSSVGDFYVLNVRDWVVGIAMNEAEDVLMLKQFRFGRREVTLEFPGGLLDKGESAMAGAQRELLEETGKTGRTVTQLGTLSPNPALQGNRCHYFLFRDMEHIHDGEPDPHESFELIWVARDDLEQEVLRGHITHGVVVGGIFLLNAYFRS